MTDAQRNSAANAILEQVIREERDLKRFVPGSLEHADIAHGLKSLRDLQCTFQCFYKLGPHAFTLEADAIVCGSDFEGSGDE